MFAYTKSLNAPAKKKGVAISAVAAAAPASRESSGVIRRQAVSTLPQRQNNAITASATRFQTATCLVITANAPSAPASTNQERRPRRGPMVEATNEATRGNSMEASVFAF